VRGRRVRLAITLGVVGYIIGMTAYMLIRSVPTSNEVRGLLIDVQSREIVNADAVTLRDATGAEWTLRVSPEVAANREHPNTASHLRQHMTNADPVIVQYRETTEGLLATRIFDADERQR